MPTPRCHGLGQLNEQAITSIRYVVCTIDTYVCVIFINPIYVA